MVNILSIKASSPATGMTYRELKKAIAYAENMGIDENNVVRVHTGIDMMAAFSGQGIHIVEVKLPVKDEDDD